jgi:hypothetical protein
MREPIPERRGYDPDEPTQVTLARRDCTILYSILANVQLPFQEVQLEAVARFLAEAWGAPSLKPKACSVRLGYGAARDRRERGGRAVVGGRPAVEWLVTQTRAGQDRGDVEMRRGLG